MFNFQFISLLFAMMTMCVSAIAQDTPNARQAKQMLLEAYNRAFSEGGATMHYRVNIAGGLYKTEGTIWYKGKKKRFVSKNSRAWDDGVTAYVVKDKKKNVEMYKASSTKKSKYEDKFKFNPDDYNYSIASEKDGYVITLKARKGVDGVKEARVLLDKRTRAPKHLKIKVGIIWANITVSNFQAGNIDDSTFVFPKAQFSGYKFIDKRDEE